MKLQIGVKTRHPYSALSYVIYILDIEFFYPARQMFEAIFGISKKVLFSILVYFLNISHVAK